MYFIHVFVEDAKRPRQENDMPQLEEMNNTNEPSLIKKLPNKPMAIPQWTIVNKSKRDDSTDAAPVPISNIQEKVREPPSTGRPVKEEIIIQEYQPRIENIENDGRSRIAPR